MPPKRRSRSRGFPVRRARSKQQRPRQLRRHRVRLGTALLRLCGGFLFLSIATIYFSPLRSAARQAHIIVAEATTAGTYFAVREAALLRYALRYGISPSLAAAIEQAALAEGIDPELAFRLVRVESGFRERAVSSAGARGLTQLMSETAESLRPGITAEEIFDRDTNLRLGFRYLRWLLRVHGGDLEEALHAYNRGPGTVARIRAAGGDPANGYAEQVLRGAHSRLPYRGDGLASPLPLPQTIFDPRAAGYQR